MEKLRLDRMVEESFKQVLPPVVLFLIDVLSQFHPEINLERVEVVREKMSAAAVVKSVESMMSALSPQHQEEVRKLARTFGEKLLDEIDKMIWEPKLQRGELVGFRRKIKRRPRRL